MHAADILTEAASILTQRGKEYDRSDEERSIPAVVTAFNAITKYELTPAQGWLFMDLVKKVRLFTAEGFHRDSAIDGPAYAALMGEAKSQETQPVLRPNHSDEHRAKATELTWIDWHGDNPSPVPYGTRVMVKHRDGEVLFAYSGEGAAILWEYSEDEPYVGDILAYAILPAGDS